MSLREKVERALRRYLKPNRVELRDNDGITGYVISPRFRRMNSLRRQTLIYEALQDSASRLTPEEIQRVLAIAAVTPEEYIGIGGGEE